MSFKLIELALRGGALMLAEKPSWLLRSQRMSPYFFDGGRFATGSVLSEIGEMFAKSLLLHSPPSRWSTDRHTKGHC